MSDFFDTVSINGESITVLVEYQIEPSDPEVGIMSEGANIYEILNVDGKDIYGQVSTEDINRLTLIAENHLKDN